MFKPQTKDKRLIGELKQKNHGLEEEVVRLKAKIAYLENPYPYELSLKMQEQQLAAQRKMDEEKSRLNYIYGMGRRY